MFSKLISNDSPFRNSSRNRLPSSGNAELRTSMSIPCPAAAAGQGIDIEVLNSAFPELGNRFRDEFLKGLSLLINFENIGIAARKSGNPAPITPEMAVQAGGGEELLREWQGWYDSHYGDML